MATDPVTYLRDDGARVKCATMYLKNDRESDCDCCLVYGTRDVHMERDLNRYKKRPRNGYEKRPREKRDLERETGCRKEKRDLEKSPSL